LRPSLRLGQRSSERSCSHSGWYRDWGQVTATAGLAERSLASIWFGERYQAKARAFRIAAALVTSGKA
ncbi:MAG: hypothetical protein ABIP55_01705, partial [Tepidisphaeraceae bacterium]